jgi:hypothetical protein
MKIKTKYSIGEKVFVLCPVFNTVRQHKIICITTTTAAETQGNSNHATTTITYHLDHPNTFTEAQLFSTAEEIIEFLKNNIQYKTL